MQGLLRLLPISLAFAAWALVLPAASVFGHSEYESSTPAKSEAIAAPSATVDIYLTLDLFKEAGGNDVRVFDEAANRVDNGNTVVDDDNRRHMFVQLQPNLPPGRYIVRWKTLSDDDQEPFGGAFAFYIAVTPATEQLHEDRELEEQAELEFEQAGEATPPVLSSPEPTAVVPVQTNSNEDDDGGAPIGLIIGVVITGAVILIGGGIFAIIQRRQDAGTRR